MHRSSIVARMPLGSVDHAWLRMDRPDNPMVITGVLTFDEPVDVERLRTTIEARLEPFRRFAQRVRPRRFGRAVWEDDRSFRVERHVEHRLLPGPADRATLQREIAALVSSPLPFDRPLWALDLLENPRDGRTVLVARLHHCLADGFALMRVPLGFTDDAPDAPHTARPAVPELPRRLPRPHDDVLGASSGSSRPRRQHPQLRRRGAARRLGRRAARTRPGARSRRFPRRARGAPPRHRVTGIPRIPRTGTTP